MSKSGITPRENDQLMKAFDALSFEDKIGIFSSLICPVNVLMKVNGYHLISVTGKLERKSKDEFEVEYSTDIYAQFGAHQITAFQFSAMNLDHTIFVDLDK